MKKILFLLLITTISYGQALFDKGVKITGGQTTTTATNKIISQESNGVLNQINATSLPVSTATTNALDLRTENSAGAIQGFAITNNGNGTVNIASGTAYLRMADDAFSPLIKYTIPAVTNLALTDNANNFILVDYNGGSPTLSVTLSPASINTRTNSIAYLISRVGTTLDYIALIGQNIDANAKLRQRFLNSESLRRASGAVLTGSNRNLLITAGQFYSGLISVTTPSFNTSTTSTFTQVYVNSGWNRTTGNTQINNTQYNLAGTLTTLPTNDYRVDYVYVLADNPSKLYVILGDNHYPNINEARLAPVPVNIPSELQYLGTRIGRIIIQKNATTMEVSSEYAVIYQAGTATLHNDLGGLNLGDYQHLTVAEKANNELKTNKAIDFSTINNTLYPSVQATKTYVDSKVPTTYSKIVYVNATSPTTATIFDLNNPPITNDDALKLDVNNLYVSTDASTWVYITSPAGYVTKVVSSETSNFYLSGTTTDAGNSKTASISRTGNITIGANISSLAKLNVTGNINSSSLIARGTYLNNTLIATANNDVLVGLDIMPTFTTGAFTGVSSYAMRISGNIIPSGSNLYSFGAPSFNFSQLHIRQLLSSGTNGFEFFPSYTVKSAQWFTSGNLLLQNGGTFTDAGYRFDVNGTTRLQSTVTLGTSPTTSAGTYDVLTRNISTGVIEKKLSSDFALSSSVILTSGSQTATGRKTFTSDNTIAGGISILNTKTTAGTNFGDNFGININNSGTIGMNVDSSSGIGVRAFSGSGTAINASKASGAVALTMESLHIEDTGDFLTISPFGVLNAIRIRADATLKLREFTVATLPTIASGQTAYATVTDAITPTYLGLLVGGGTVKCPVFYNGTNWVSH